MRSLAGSDGMALSTVDSLDGAEEEAKVATIIFEDCSNPDGCFLMGEREKLVKECANWLNRDRSAVVGTLQFTESIGIEAAEQAFEEWKRKAQAGNVHPLEWRGGPQLRMLAQIRWCHVLVKGFRPFKMNGAMRLWERDHGRARLHIIYPEWMGLPSDESRVEDGDEYGDE